jgi:hypothetical protein
LVLISTNTLLVYQNGRLLHLLGFIIANLERINIKFRRGIIARHSFVHIGWSIIIALLVEISLEKRLFDCFSSWKITDKKAPKWVTVAGNARSYHERVSSTSSSRPWCWTVSIRVICPHSPFPVNIFW